jgi:sigma-B regulation protein RsbU (phosphoserine phosphatase)
LGVPSKSQRFRLPLVAGASLFAAATALYSGVWTYAVRHKIVPVEIGYNGNPVRHGNAIQVESVVPNGPAEKSGLRVGDFIVATNGRGVKRATEFLVDEAWWNGRPGEPVELTVERRGVGTPLTLRPIFRAAKAAEYADSGIVKRSTLEVLSLYPMLFLLIGVAVLFLRLDDPNAWLLAMTFAGFIAVPGFSPLNAVRPELYPFALTYRAIFDAFLCPLFYWFFAVFPARASMDRRFPWLKWAGLGWGALVAVTGLPAGDPQVPEFLTTVTGIRGGVLMRVYNYGFLALGFAALATNAFGSFNVEVRRKARVIFWGTLAGILPIVCERAAADFFHFDPPFWLDSALVIILALFPLSFAYAVVKHRVLEIPVLLKRSARYVLVRRGFALLGVVISAAAVLVFSILLPRVFPGRSGTGISLAFGVGFGAVLTAVSQESFRRGSRRIDRAFFRSAYDAREILQDLAQRARTVSGHEELGALLEKHIRQALYPKFLAGFFDTGGGVLKGAFGPVPRELETVSSSLPALHELVRRGKSWEVLDSAGLGPWAALNPEILVPIPARDNRLLGVVMLGERLSEEPYSGEDKHLLDSVASQAGIALENLQLAESIAERLEAERRAERDLEIAREVQARLFPQKSPPQRTLDYAGGCIQARRVGGDYYDFLDLGAGRLGIVLADISGKGIPAALLMANLQANLRSQYALALEDLPRLLQSVNQLFYQNSAPQSYATMVFADYDDGSRRLRYVNCGHNPPIVLRRVGTVERLEATATVIGLFEEWQCSVHEVMLDPGDLFVFYTDGVTEAPDASGDEFGEARMVETIRSNAALPVDRLLARIQAAVLEFGGEEQADDLTLVVGRAR